MLYTCNKKGFSDIRILKRWSNRGHDVHGGNRNLSFAYKKLQLITRVDEVQACINLRHDIAYILKNYYLEFDVNVTDCF